MAFDLSGAVQQARTGTIPPEWRRFPLQRNFVWQAILVYSIFSIFCVGVGVNILVTGSIWNDSFTAIKGLVALTVGIGLLVTFIRLILRLRDSDGHFFLVTPEGFAEVRGENVVGLAFAEVADLKGLLVVRKRTGGTMRLGIRGYYGPPREILMTLQEKLAGRR